MLIFTTLRRPEYSLAMSSSIGAIDLHGPHHSAQKSSNTGVSDFSTSVSKSASLTWVMCSLMVGPATGMMIGLGQGGGGAAGLQARPATMKLAWRVNCSPQPCRATHSWHFIATRRAVQA